VLLSLSLSLSLALAFALALALALALARSLSASIYISVIVLYSGLYDGLASSACVPVCFIGVAGDNIPGRRVCNAWYPGSDSILIVSMHTIMHCVRISEFNDII
jgi:hypothetical protein